MKIRSYMLLSLVFLCVFIVACGGAAATTTTSPVGKGTATTASTRTGGPSTSFQLGGLVKQPGSETLSDLQRFSKASVSVNVKPIGAHVFAGALLYDVLQQHGIVTQSSRKNDLLRKSVLVAGTDGYTVAVSWGELDPQFANKKILLAYEEDGKPLPQADGFARLIVPGDNLAGRYVSNVASILINDPGVVPSLRSRQPTQAFFLTGLVNAPAKYDLTALKALKTTDVTVQGTTYSGVLLSDLLQHAGLQLKPKKNDFLHKGIVAIGSDGYSCVLSDGEINPSFGNMQALVAFAANGQALSGADGFARLIVPTDQKMGRFVSNLQELQVVELAQ